MTAPARFKQQDITRALRGARAAGFTRVRVGIDVTGNMVIDAADDSVELPAPANPLDRILPRR
ncbi:hypothetical protein AWL63_06340 [Sphingomonas panacis]|uniref:Uncharacterized protein n=1 Tax=Sphingomonas panacis TaxID=1560345 RepID=A0A1B3Z899_9SPHN|nr:hypothetical protein [Sphingomonas panacis]AOH83650.1 hypothetical protein AWL63_06340 [Sphingomonas panacis]